MKDLFVFFVCFVVVEVVVVVVFFLASDIFVIKALLKIK